MRLQSGIVSLCLLWAAMVWGIEPAAAPSTDAVRLMSTLRLPPEVKITLFAEAPQLGSPVAIGLDERNRVFVAEEYRFNRGTEENRTRPFLLEDDLQIQTLDDRLRMFQKFADRFEGGMDWFSKYSDQVRLLTDSDGDGRADQSTIFAGGFNGPLDGLAAGVMARDGDVYLTCIPHLWLLRDEDGDGVAEVRKPVHTGFGVNAAFLGHDLHGLCWGPDGKLYFSVGDRGFHVRNQEGQVLTGPRTGAVFRCYPDGSELEVVHRGLRNPQEIAFDQFGNLFAADNNCDKGDHSRLVYVVEGGESGWNMAYQSLPDPYLTGPWHAERLWHLAHPGQPAWIVPPVGKLGSGPSGFCFNPGTSLPERFRNVFLLCNYTGDDGIEAIKVREQGAGFEITGQEDFLKPIFATDAEFGYDGKLYVSDFVELEWSGASKGGRVFTVFDPQALDRADVREVKSLFEQGFHKRSREDLLGFLAHADLRVRQRAQFTLASRGPDEIPGLLNVARTGTTLLARLHAIWALGQFRGAQPDIEAGLLELLADADPEVRAQTAKVFGQQHWHAADRRLLELLQDEAPRVRFFAAQSLGRNKATDALRPLIELARANGDADPFVRHAVVQALVNLNRREELAALMKDPDASVRLIVLLVQRRWADPRVADFLDDRDPGLATEAARAINDLPLESETGRLAEVIRRADPARLPDPLVRRAMHANFRLGTAAHAQVVLNVVLNSQVTPALRDEGLRMLADWSQPGSRDRVTGFWRPLMPRDAGIVAGVLRESSTQLLSQTSGDLQLAAMQLITQLQIPIDTSTFHRWLTEPDRAVAERVAALQLLLAVGDARGPELLEQALQSDRPELRSASRALILQRDAVRGFDLLSAAWKNPETSLMEKRQALRTVSSSVNEAAIPILTAVAEELLAGRVPPELRVDVIEATRGKEAAPLQQALATYRQQLEDPGQPGKWFSQALVGGDPAQGEKIFRRHATAQCFRCHRIGGLGGDAGPDLSQVGKRAPREHILESLIDPNAKLAPGFGSVAYVLTDGRVISGTLQAEDSEKVVVKGLDGTVTTLPVADIEERTAAKSAMPSMTQTLSLGEIRDLVEYLSLQKE